MINKRVVYLVLASNGLIKIGQTIKLKERMSTLKGLSPLPLKLLCYYELNSRKDALIVEKKAHIILKFYHSHCEWFFSTPERTIATIEQILRDMHLAHTSHVFTIS